MPQPVLTALLALGLLIVPACRPLYLPPVPDVPPQQQYTRLSSASQVTLVDGRPLLAVVLAEVVGPEGGGWLNVQWFGPSNAQVASDSVWVSWEDVGRTFEFALPDDVETTSGEWRVVVSHGGYLLRQFRVEVP